MSDLVADLRGLAVWPVSTADTWPDTITPRHSKQLYAASNAMREAADKLEAMQAALEVIAGGDVDVSDTAIIVGNNASTVMRQVRAALNLTKERG